MAQRQKPFPSHAAVKAGELVIRNPDLGGDQFT